MQSIGKFWGLDFSLTAHNPFYILRHIDECFCAPNDASKIFPEIKCFKCFYTENDLKILKVQIFHDQQTH